jgi:hypothetical protein
MHFEISTGWTNVKVLVPTSLKPWIVGVKRCIMIKLNRNIVVLIRCSIHSKSVLVRYTSNISTLNIFDNMVYDWPMELMWNQHTSRLFCIKIYAVNYSSLVTLFYSMLHLKSYIDNKFCTCYWIESKIIKSLHKFQKSNQKGTGSFHH